MPDNIHDGLNPLDLLNLPPEQRDLVNWLSRHKQARFEDIRQALNTDAIQLTAVLHQLKHAGHIHEALIDGEIYYRVMFGGKVSRAARGLPENIWSRLDLDNTVFLRQMPLFGDLSEDDLLDFAGKLEARHYHRNEVIFWQGGVGEGVYLIKSGIVGTTRLSSDKRMTHILSYHKEGDLLGEYGLLFDQDTTASATATALSDVELLVIRRDKALTLLKQYPSAAIELVKLLAQRLIDSRAEPKEAETLLCLVIGVVAGAGCTTVGSALATTLAHVTHNSVVYTEHPRPEFLPDVFGFAPDIDVFSHPGGYDVLVPQGLSGLPATVRTTLVLERLTQNYANVIIGISGAIDDTVIHMLARANEVVLVVPPSAGAWERLNALTARLKPALRANETRLTVACNRPDAAHRDVSPPGQVDFDIPYLGEFSSPAPKTTLPAPLATAASDLANRLGRINQIGVYLPVEEPAQPYIEQTVAFLSHLFGSANQSASHTGPSGEPLTVVQTCVTRSELDRHLGDVLAFIERLKTELGQDAMALELNEKVMVI